MNFFGLSFGELFMMIFVGNVLIYILFRFASLAVFTSWSQVSKYKCYSCSLFNEAKEKELKHEKEKDQKTQG